MVFIELMIRVRHIFINTGLYLISRKLLKLIPSNYYDVTDLIKKAKKKNHRKL